jgi:mannose-6-phosphate isomerase-like protein (cupin superfamily)
MAFGTSDHMDSVEYIRHQDKITAIIISNRFKKDGIHFFTPDEFSQQLAYMNHPAGKQIEPHFHNEVHRNVTYTQEVLLVKKGKLQVDFYDGQQAFLESRVLLAGDVILLASGGHGFKVLEEVEMIEIKQGPYQGDGDKTRFNPKSQ